MVSRRQVLQGAAASVGLAATSTVTRRLPRARAVPPYSVVFVLVDDTRFDYRGLLNVFATGPWINCTSAAAQTPMCAIPGVDAHGFVPVVDAGGEQPDVVQHAADRGQHGRDAHAAPRDTAPRLSAST